MSVRRQTNVTLSPEMAEKIERFAERFHRGEFAAAARVLIEEGLEHIRTEQDYLKAFQRSSVNAKKSTQAEGTYGKQR